MFNNKGQSLVLFVIILPILLIILILVIDIGRVILLKNELDSINKIVLDYGLDEMSDIDNKSNVDGNLLNNNVDDIKNRIKNIIMLNKDDIDTINIDLKDNKIYIYLEDSINGIFSKLIDISIFDVKSSYVGYIDNDKKRIERVSGD